MKEKKKSLRKLWMGCLCAILLTGLWSVTALASGLEAAEKAEDLLTTLPQVTDLKQTKATNTSITISWKRPAGATMYGINIKAAGETSYTRENEITSDKSTVTYTIKNLKSNTFYDVQVFAGSNTDPYGELVTIRNCRTAPGKVVGLSYYAYPSSKRMSFYWNRKDTADGYELYKYSLDGKLLSRYDLSGRYSTRKTIGVGNNFYSYRIRAYTMVNGTKCRGPLRYFYTALQPAAGKVTQTYGSSSVTMTWGKINGANYEVYQSLSKDGPFKKVDTVSTNQLTLKNLTKGKTYYYKIRATKKINGTTYKSPDTYIYYFTKR